MAFSGKLIAISSITITAVTRVWDTATGSLLTTKLYGLFSVAFLPNGKRLATGGSYNWAVRLWDTKSLKNVLTFPGDSDDFHDLAFSPDGNVIGALNMAETLYLWRAPSWRTIHAVEQSHAKTAIHREPALPTETSFSSEWHPVSQIHRYQLMCSKEIKRNQGLEFKQNQRVLAHTGLPSKPTFPHPSEILPARSRLFYQLKILPVTIHRDYRPPRTDAHRDHEPGGAVLPRRLAEQQLGPTGFMGSSSEGLLHLQHIGSLRIARRPVAIIGFKPGLRSAGLVRPP